MGQEQAKTTSKNFREKLVSRKKLLTFAPRFRRKRLQRKAKKKV
jgi:hypothetical protein